MLLAMNVWRTMRRHVFPPVCLFCHEALSEDGCCAACLDGIRLYPKAHCHTCGASLPESLAPGPCGHCLQQAPPQQSTQSLFVYQGAVRDAILAWKLQGDDAAMRVLLHSAQGMLKSLIHTGDVLIPIPMPLSRMRQRGRHHGADLCRMMAGLLDVDWDWTLLRRQGEQVRQSALTAKQRRKNLRKAFVLRPDYASTRVDGTLWLVDDIITTGSTVYYAAHTLRATGRPIRVLSLARTWTS